MPGIRTALLLAAAGATAATAVVLARPGTSAVDRTAAGKLTLVAYSTPREAYAKLIDAFRATPAGKDTDFEQSYGSSGEQARAVIAGLRADVAALSLEPDMTALVKAGKVAPNWSKDKFGGMVTRSVVVFAVREGNPKKIKTWDDLVKPGVEVVTPNPSTSGGAKWNVMAAYGAQLRAGKSHAQAMAYMRRLFQHTVSMDKSAREALQTFLSGRGDVLLAYENEAIFAQQKRQPLFFVIPKATIRIENPIAVTTNSQNRATARAFVAFLRSTAGQRIFAQNGYRPVLLSANKGFNFPVRPELFTIEYLGGWATVDQRFFDPNSGLVTRLLSQLGK